LSGTLKDEIELNEMLLASGAPISAMNVVRTHLSNIKGGRLAAATLAPVVSLIVSDIPGDNPAYVGSGPTVPNQSTRHEALDIIAQYGLKLPEAALKYLNSEHATSPRPDEPVLSRNSHHIVASAAVSLQAAASLARQQGLHAVILSDAIEGESRDVALVHAAIAREVVLRNRPFVKPVVMLSGGETTVTLRSSGGRGGRNSEFALAAALALDGLNFHLLAADTDGIDGSEDNAGAFADGLPSSDCAPWASIRGVSLMQTTAILPSDRSTTFSRLDLLEQTSMISERYYLRKTLWEPPKSNIDYSRLVKKM